MMAAPVPERRIPAVPWRRVWLLACALVVVAVFGLELFVRGRGYQPSVKDDEYAWALERARASDGSDHTVAILGNSRILLAFDPHTFEAELPDYRYIQLAINGTMPMASLHDLARDPEFRGIALVDAAEGAFITENRERQGSYLDVYARGWRAPGALAERQLATLVQSHVALLAVNGMRVLQSVSSGHGFPAPPYVVTFPDRTKYADYSLADAAAKRKARLELLATPMYGDDTTAAGWLGEAMWHEDAVTEIQRRGGRVVYVRLPTCDERWESDERWTPKSKYWDRLARHTKAATIHFRDVPALADLRCPDTSHIDSKDGPRFTRGLIEALRARGVIKGR